jgi:hypothetical protein
MQFLGQNSTQYPHPLHKASLITISPLAISEKPPSHKDISSVTFGYLAQRFQLGSKLHQGDYIHY